MLDVIVGGFQILLTGSLWLLVGYVLLDTFNHATLGVLKTTRRVDGKVIVVTGANQGIGYETALELVRRGGHVILACRNLTRAENAKQRIEDTLKQEAIAASEKVGKSGRAGASSNTPDSLQNGSVTIIQLDLCSFASVRRFVKELSALVDHVDILINNAGIAPNSEKRVSTEDGLEETFQANFLGHFLLTNLMLPLLEKAPQARIVNVTSMLYLFGRVDPTQLEQLVAGSGKVPNGTRYMDTKLAIVMWTRELAWRLKGTGITANCLHPGLVKTQIAGGHTAILPSFVHYCGLIFGKDARAGAHTQLAVALGSDGGKISGAYFVDCGRMRLLRGTNREANKELWEVTEKIIKNAETRRLLANE